MKKNNFEKLFPNGLLKNQTVPFIQKGDWAIYEILPFLLSVTGNANVKIATFNISEDSLRAIFFLLEKKNIDSIKLLVDMNVRRHKLDMLLFAANIMSDVRLTSNHSKILLVENSDWQVGVVGSANLNKNPRYESGFVFTNTEFYNYFSKEFDNIFENDSIKYMIDND